MAFVAPPGYQPIYSPTIPYVGPIYGGLRPGMSIYIQGHIPHHISRFHINLQCGEMEGSDIAFHFNPRFDFWDKVVFNTFQNGMWEGEEKIHNMPFHKGKNFETVIVVNFEGYQVNINGQQFYFYQHRIPVDRVCALEIGGDVTIQTINITGGAMQGYPGGMAGGFPVGGMQGMCGGVGYPGQGGNLPGGMGYPGQGGNLPVMGGMPIYNPSIPYADMIPGGMTPKRTIVIRGMVPFGARRFAVNFMVSGTRDIAFHFHPRLMEGVILRNSFYEGCWGEEELEIGYNPFLEGQYFELSIRCGNRRFKVYVNGEHLCNFHHRFQPFGQVNMLEIEGDVQLSYIHF
ncbi:galectin-4-like isoform X2 [Scleropages formosus]|uniref:galectin-4-like isoform X2 n=1 Tax=Scleropages formosus TaxID=113540 RepID=UPI0008788B81|nr:galectin-4-like isoform X2 [Scleropages formosus]